MPAISPLRFRAGDTLIMRTAEADQQLFTVVCSNRQGYVLRTNDHADPQRWSHDELYRIYVDGHLDHYAANLAALGEGLADVIQADWESWRPELRAEAERRLAYCEYVDRLANKRVKLSIAWRRSASTVWRRNRVSWLADANRLAGRAEGQDEEQIRAARHCLADPKPAEIDEPSEFSVRDWHRRWRKAGKDVRALLPLFHRRGNRKPKPELQCKLHLQEHFDRPLCVYGAMRYIARKIYMRQPRPPRKFAHRELKDLCKAGGYKAISYQGFCNFLNNHFTDFEEYKARYGAKKAFFKFGIFARREAPDVPLEEVEVDHTLLDIFVVDAFGRVGRPWLTILICRATRCIVGMHISFDVPSYATLGRAVLHSMCPKDLHGIEGIENDWPCHGVPRAIITDRGLEFLSEAFRRAGKLIGFAVVNLPGRCPYLKGTVERFFGTLNIRVLSHLEGTTHCRSVESYDSPKKAKYTLAELTQKIVRWIVDDYHQTEHPSLGKAPAARWNEQADKFKVRPIPSFRLLITQLGELVTRKVGNTGIQFENHTYASKELEQLRHRRGGLQKDWHIRIDPYDRGEVFVLDEMKRTWISVPAVHQKTSRGISKFQARLHMRIARTLVPAGADVTHSHLEQAMELCGRAAKTSKTKQAQRYFADGSVATALAMNLGLGSVANSNEAPALLPVSPSGACRADPCQLPTGNPETVTTSWSDLLSARLRQESAAG
jgi:putative transposase